MIIEAIANVNAHMSAEDVFEEVRRHTQATNLATVYRTLDMLWEEGLASRNDLGEGRMVYSILEHGPHIHLICRSCNKVIDALPESLGLFDENLFTRYGFKIDLTHLSLFGECEECRKSVVCDDDSADISV
jgi:Fur family ferric uptake transcriptional regulator